MKERLIKALDIILVKQHLEVLKKDKLNSLERALTGRYSEGYGEEAITEITAKLESGNVRIMAEFVDDVLGELYQYCKANSKTGEMLDADPEYNKAYKKVVKRLGRTLQNGYDALQAKLKDIGCKKVSYTIVEDQLRLAFKYKGEKGVLYVISDYSNGAIDPMSITLKLSTEDNLNLKFLKRLNKILKK